MVIIRHFSSYSVCEGVADASLLGGRLRESTVQITDIISPVNYPTPLARIGLRRGVLDFDDSGWLSGLAIETRIKAGLSLLTSTGFVGNNLSDYLAGINLHHPIEQMERTFLGALENVAANN